MRLPTRPATALSLLFITILLPTLPLLGSDGTDESSTTSSPVPARLRMAPDTLEQTDPRNCVSQAAEMANAENLAGYLECFSAGSQMSFGASKPATHRRLKTGHRVGGTGWKNPLNRPCWQGCWRQLLAV